LQGPVVETNGCTEEGKGKEEACRQWKKTKEKKQIGGHKKAAAGPQVQPLTAALVRRGGLARNGVEAYDVRWIPRAEKPGH